MWASGKYLAGWLRGRVFPAAKNRPNLIPKRQDSTQTPEKLHNPNSAQIPTTQKRKNFFTGILGELVQENSTKKQPKPKATKHLRRLWPKSH